MKKQQSNNKRKYIMKIWDMQNVIFLLLTVVTSIIFTYFFVCSLIETENGFYIGMCGVFASLSSAFFVAFIVRYIEFKNKKTREKVVLDMLKPAIHDLLATISYFLPQISKFSIIGENYIRIPKEVVYYKNNSKKTREFINFKHELSVSHINTQKKIEKCISIAYIMNSNSYILTIISKLKINKFTDYLYEISQMDFIGKCINFNRIQEEHEELKKIVEEIGKIFGINTNIDLIELTPDEEEAYKTAIKNFTKNISLKREIRGYYNKMRII